MADRYQALIATPVGRMLVKRLGLPNPVPLRRFCAGDPPVTGKVLVGGDGRLRGEAVAAIAAAGGGALTAPESGANYTGLVFDATALGSSHQLVALQGFFSPVVRSVGVCGRIVVLGTTPNLTGTPQERVAQRALEGFTRSLGKEAGRGTTVQLVYVAPDADDRLSSTLVFLLSAKSAYVSGQVVRISASVPAPESHDVSAQQPFAGKVALVTGAARGIGESIARTLHRDGAAVVGVDVPRADSDLRRLMVELGGDSIAVDITTVDAPQRIARRLSEQHGGVDVVVHNAGVTQDKKVANMDSDGWSSVIDVNLAAPERLTAELLDRGLIRPNGRVIGVSSIAAIAGIPGQTNYAASKAGVIGLVDTLAPIAAESSVTVNAVAPGFIETQMTANMPFVIRAAGRRMNSLGQGGLPVDVAETIAWLADPRSYGVTGNVVRVCGQSLLGA